MPRAWSAKRERKYDHIKDGPGRSKMNKAQLERAVGR